MSAPHLSVHFMSQEPNKPDVSGALSAFCTQYDPATKDTATDYFSSKEIQALIREHSGLEIDLQNLCELLQKMGYCSDLQGGKFMWLVKKD